jgi:hypothetical protein
MKARISYNENGLNEMIATFIMLKKLCFLARQNALHFERPTNIAN